MNMTYDKLLKRKRIVDGVLFEEKAFHPTAFKSNVFAVSFYPKNKKFLTDKDIAFTQVSAANSEEAIEKAREDLDYDVKRIATDLQHRKTHKKLVHV